MLSQAEAFAFQRQVFDGRAPNNINGSSYQLDGYASSSSNGSSITRDSSSAIQFSHQGNGRMTSSGADGTPINSSPAPEKKKKKKDKREKGRFVEPHFPFKVIFQKLVLDVDLYQKALVGYTDIRFTPLHNNITQINLHCLQCRKYTKKFDETHLNRCIWSSCLVCQ